MRGIALMGMLWAVALLIVGAAGKWSYGATATAVMAFAVGIFAVGECLHGAIHVPLAVDLARPGLVGRYLALSSVSWQIGWIVGPAGGGFVLQHAPLWLWPGAALLNLVGAAYALALERRLPRKVRTTPRRTEPILLPAEV
jgi:MFS family permease